jgi:hypothetical protein
MLNRLLLIRPVPPTCLVSISKRYIRTPAPVISSTPVGLTPTAIKEETTAVDSTGKSFTFKHGYVI